MENKTTDTDAMEWARSAAKTYLQVLTIEEAAQALIEYSNLRAHTAHMSAYREGLQRLSDERKRASKAELDAKNKKINVAWEAALEQVQREARAAAIEEAAQIARKYADNPTSSNFNNTQAAFDLGMDHRAGCQDSASAIEQAIRALPTTPPQSEGGHRIEPTEMLQDGSKFKQQDV